MLLIISAERMEIKAERVCKSFGDYTIFKNINLRIQSGQCVGIVGPNGSGKTTLVRVLSKLISPSSGTVSYTTDQQEFKQENIYQKLGFVGPYLELYQDLTAAENLEFFSKMKRLKNYTERIENLMNKFQLQGREEDQVKTFSSGMKQRLKYIAALLHTPEVLFVDEPRANLDEEGIRTIYEVLEEQKKEGILILATNDSDDLQFADWTVAVNA